MLRIIYLAAEIAKNAENILAASPDVKSEFRVEKSQEASGQYLSRCS